jgi:hypothetical protein
MKLRYILPILLLLCFTTPLCLAQASDETIDKVLELSGLVEQVSQIPGQIMMGMEQARLQGAAIPEDFHNAMLATVESSIAPSDIIEEIGNSLQQQISDSEAQDLLAWYQSDLGRKITAAEEKASSPDAFQQMVQEAQIHLANSERVKFAKTIDSLLGATDMAVGIQEYTGIAVYSAIMTAMQPGVPLNLDRLKAQISASSAQTRAALQQMIILNLVYAYRTIDTEELARYEGV